MSFERWYSEVAVGDDGGTRLKAREVGLTSLTKSASPDLLEVLLRVVLGGRLAPDQMALAAFRQPFINADPNFETSGNAEELRVLAASTLAHIMRTSTSLSPLAVTTVLAAGLGGARTWPTQVPLVEIAKQELAKDAELTRRRPDLQANLAELPKLDFDKAKAKIDSQQDFAGVTGALPLVAESIRAALKTVLQRQADAYSAISTYVRVQDEELDMLWWLVGSRSLDFDCAFDKLPAETQPLVLAKELADRTQTLPGPIAVRPLLSRAGLKDAKKITVVGSVNKLEAVWSRALVDGIPISPVTTPIHFALQRELETGSGDAWIAGWSAASGLDSGSSLTPLQLAVQFYFERLLLIRK